MSVATLLDSPSMTKISGLLWRIELSCAYGCQNNSFLTNQDTQCLTLKVLNF